MSHILLISILAYVAFQLVIGVIVSRRIRGEDDYLVAGRRLGPVIATATIFATWFGAETCIGSAGAIYEEGLAGGRADPFGYALCILFMGMFFAAAFWRRKYVTIADLFRTRFGGAAEKIAVLLMVPTSLLWAAAQVRAFGQILAASSELNITIAITVAAGVVIVYTAMGGILADAITDLVQGLVLIIGLAITALVVFAGADGGAALRAAFEPDRLRMVAEGESMFAAAESWAIPIIGSLFAQELVSRTLASRSAALARGACFAAAGIYVAVGLIPVLFGLAGPALVPGLEHGEQVLPRVAQEYLPTAVYVIFAGALVSAILSTVDSSLLAASALTSHNFVAPLLKTTNDKFRLRSARVLVIVYGVIAYAMAMSAEGVYALVEEASAFGSSGLFAVIVLGMWTRRGGPVTACATLVTGVVSYVGFAYGLSWAGVEVSFPYILSLAASVVCYVALMAIERTPEPPAGSAAPATRSSGHAMTSQ